MNQTPNNPRMNFVNRLLAGNPQLRTQVSQMTLAASQQAQNNYLVNQLRPAPGPAYIVQNPYAGTGTLGCQIAGLTGCCNMAA